MHPTPIREQVRSLAAEGVNDCEIARRLDLPRTHGLGQKHHRRILLEPWQQRLVGEAPWAFLRGCVHSDGCFFINRTGPYRYLSVDFHNRSADILDLFAAACERVGVKHRRYERRVRIYERASVREFAALVGTKR